MDYLATIFPSLLICGFIGLVILIGIAASMVWFRYVDGYLRACPECHRRGAGYIVETETVSSHSHTDYKGRNPVRITEEHIIDHYQCEHCDHK
ncbi:MAG: hypothetical protein ACE5GO_01135, partial [Anaerolineales bacterium]